MPQNEHNPADRRPVKEKKPWRVRIRHLAIDVAIVVGVLLAIQAWRNRDMLGVGGSEPAPAFSLVDARSGEIVSLSDFEGDTLMVHFWAPWCGICKREFGMLNRLSTELDEGEAFVSIVTDWESQSYIEAFMAREDVRFAVLLADDAVMNDYRISVFPTNYYINASGNIRSRSTGMATAVGIDRRMGCAGR